MPDEDKRADAPVGDVTPDPVIPDAELVADPVVMPPAEAAPVMAPPARRPSVVPPFLGGVAAAAIGFGAAQFVPQGWPLAPVDTLRQTVEGQAAQIAALQTTVDQLAARPESDASSQIAALRSEIEQRLAALPSGTDAGPDLAALRQRLDEALASFDTRLARIESVPAGPEGQPSGPASAALAGELQALRAQVDQLRGSGGEATAAIQDAVASAKAELAATAQEAARLKTEAETAARTARIDAALGRIRAALDAGGPFAAAAADLTEAGIALPPLLSDAAAHGVEPLSALQASFPAAARAGLDAALRADVGDTWTDRLGSFLRTQTGARSLEPRAGDDPDAILSRAEAALDAGDLGAALTELAALPEAAKAPMADWIAAADERRQAEEAISTVASSVDTQ